MEIRDWEGRVKPKEAPVSPHRNIICETPGKNNQNKIGLYFGVEDGLKLVRAALR